MTGITALRSLGLDLGESAISHFVIAGDHHLALDGVMLHRTERMPVCGDEAVRPVAAFVEYCRWSSVLDAICAGDWLLNQGHMTSEELAEFLHVDDWRDGVAQATWVRPLLDGRSRSIPESRCRAYLIFAGLPWPEVNIDVVVNGEQVAITDLAFPEWNVAVEYEGGHHQVERRHLRDIDRYAVLRRQSIDYLQVTRELARTPIKVATSVHRLLVRNGYVGPAPIFGPTWRLLFGPIPTGKGAVDRRPFRPQISPRRTLAHRPDQTTGDRSPRIA